MVGTRQMHWESGKGGKICCFNLLFVGQFAAPLWAASGIWGANFVRGKCPSRVACLHWDDHLEHHKLAWRKSFQLYPITYPTYGKIYKYKTN